MVGYMPRWFTRPQTVTHPSTNQARRRATRSIETNALPLSHTITSDAVSCNSLCDRVMSLFVVCVQGSYVLNNFLERLSGHRLYARLHDVLLDTGALHALRVVDTDWPPTPPAPQVHSFICSMSECHIKTHVQVKHK